VEAMRRRTRNYARRQMTWLRRLERVHEIDVTERPTADAAAAIVHILAAQPGEARSERGES
jgi:tRNA dimethylallyltransferase